LALNDMSRSRDTARRFAHPQTRGIELSSKHRAKTVAIGECDTREVNRSERRDTPLAAYCDFLFAMADYLLTHYRTSHLRRGTI